MIPSVLRRAWPLLALAATLLLIATFVARACYFRNDISFLAEGAPARWIIYPVPGFGGVRPGVPLDAIFRRTFSLASVPAAAKLDLCVFRSGTVSLNGKAVPAELDADHWKAGASCDVARFLRRGANDLAVTVTNASGPPALWLALSCPEAVVTSDKSWEVSLAGATWQPAALAADPVPLANVDPDGEAEQVIPSLGQVWPAWLIFAGLSAAAVWLCGRWLVGGELPGSGAAFQNPIVSPVATAHGEKERPRPRRAGESDPRPAAPLRGNGGNGDGRTGWWNVLLLPPGPHRRWVGLIRLLFLLIAVFWTALFLHNSPYLAPGIGFDSSGHLAYIQHFCGSWSIPLPGEGWQTHHPPLYHFLVARMLSAVGCAPHTASGILTIRLFNLLLALGNIYVILACLRLIFPEHPRRWMVGLLVAGFLPMHLYLYQYPTNHILGCSLASLAIYLVLRIVCISRAGMWNYVGLGLCLGLALLSIVSIFPLVVLAGAALLAKAYVARAEIPWRRAALRIGVVAALVPAICGWYYLYVWTNLGTPLLANTGSGPGTPWPWWQDPGFRTSGDYLRFGQSLRSPLWSAWYSVGDGLYSTLWGDSDCGGRLGIDDRPPWRYDYLVAGMLLAVAPSVALLLGCGTAIFRFLRKPTIVWSFLLAVGFVAVLVVLYGSLRVPYCFVKAFYGLAAAVPLCALAALGFDLLGASSRRLRGLVFLLVGVWALNSAASYVISPASAEAQSRLAMQLALAGRESEAAARLEQRLGAHPDDDFARLLLAKLCINRKLDDAARRLLEVPAGQCERSSRHYLLGMVLARQRHLYDAHREFQAALRLTPGDTDVASAYAQTVLPGPNPRAAIDAWRNVLRVNPHLVQAHATLARLYLKAGEPAAAHQHEKYVRALEQWIRQKKSQRL